MDERPSIKATPLVWRIIVVHTKGSKEVLVIPPTFNRRSLRILSAWFCIILVACGTSNHARECYVLNKIEQHAKVAFLPTDTVRLSSRASMSAATSESGVVRVLMGSMDHTNSVFQTYNDYLQRLIKEQLTTIVWSVRNERRYDFPLLTLRSQIAIIRAQLSRLKTPISDTLINIIDTQLHSSMPQLIIDQLKSPYHQQTLRYEPWPWWYANWYEQPFHGDAAPDEKRLKTRGTSL